MTGKWDAILDLIGYMDRVDPNNVRTQAIRDHARAARDASNVMNDLLHKHVAQTSQALPNAAITPFPAEALKQLSDEELDSLADARLDYGEANLTFGRAQIAFQSANWLQKNPALGKSFQRLWRSANIFRQLGRFQEAAKNIQGALKFPEANTYDVLHTSALILAQAGCAEDCVKAIQAAMKFPESRTFDSLVQYAGILENFGSANAAVQAVNLALPLANNAQPATVLAAAELLLKINAQTYAPYVAERLLRPLLRRQNISWSVENYLQLARTAYLVGMQQEARAALEGALRADPSRVAPLLKQEPWKSLLQQPRP